MRGNSFGKMFSLTSFGESHGPGMGVALDGVPANLDFNLQDLQKELNRRAPGKIAGTTGGSESDGAEVLSGIFEGKKPWELLSLFLLKIQIKKSSDYDQLKSDYRPGVQIIV